MNPAVDETVANRVCGRCKLDLDVSAFGVDVSSPHGLRYDCKACVSERRKREYRRDSETLRQKAREWRTSNPGKAKEASKKYYDSHAEARRDAAKRRRRSRVLSAEERAFLNAQCREWHKKNRDRASLSKKAWRAKNWDRLRIQFRQYGAKREALKRGNAVGVVDFEEIIKRDGDICYLCGEKPKKRHFDHVIPLSKGGPHSMENIRVSCSTCNWKKGARLLAA